MEGKQREGFLFEPLRKQDLNAEDNENFELAELAIPAPRTRTSLDTSCNSEMLLNSWTWCDCKKCDGMPSAFENLCCNQIKELSCKLNGSTERCVTQISSFKKMCLDKEILEVLMTAMKNAVAEWLESGITNRYFSVLL